MKRIKIILFLFLVSFVSVQAQIIGETDAVSIPDYKFQSNFSTSTSARSFSTLSTDYDDGYDAGYEVGFEDGLYDANTCSWYGTPHGVISVWPIDFQNGHADGWWTAYQIAYSQRIAEKASSCTANEEFNESEFSCSCICIKHEYYFDGDGDNYFDPNTLFKYECDPPNASWKIASDYNGVDCNDTDRTVWRYNDCGLCSSEDGLTAWYYDEDGDGYHSLTAESCSKPTSGTSSKWKTTTSGLDCDDTDKDANIEKTWYYFNDDDNYYDDTHVTCLRPLTGISTRWKIDGSLGPDCNSDDSNIFGPITWYYDNDGDGYYGQSETVCEKPTSGNAKKWVKQASGEDCDDSNPDIFIRDSCGICGTSATVVAYLDIDGDGYHSLAINDLCANNLYPVEINGYTLENSEALAALENMEPGTVYDYNERAFYGFPDRPHYYYSSTLQRVEECETTARSPSGTFCFNWYYNEVYYLNVYDENGEKKKLLGRNGNYVFLNPDEPDVYNGGRRFKNFNSTTLGLDCNDLDKDQKANGDWYYDGDGDGYYDQSISPQVSTCEPPSDQWILLENSAGPDCDDTDRTATLLITWYFDGDGDNYYGSTQQTCENPGKGTELESNWRTIPGGGLDCNDQDDEATVATRRWYYDKDEDGFYGTSTISCQNPAIGTSDAVRWKADPGSGQDCDDENPETQVNNACGVCGGSDDPIAFYVDLDGDGYHSVYKMEDCGLPSFNGQTVVNSSFPESLIPESVLNPDEGARVLGIGDCVYVDIPNTTERFKYCEYTDIFTFPESVLKTNSLGLDCDDLNPSIMADGAWYPDVDRDGYHESTTPVNSCSPPDPQAYILLANSSGEDCNDVDATINKNIKWYKDTDGDGFYVDTQISCSSPGFGWSFTASLGPDVDDNDPFTPVLQPVGHGVDFAIPSLMKLEPDGQISYGENSYDPDEISLLYRGVNFAYGDILFDQASPLMRLTPDKLVIGAELVLPGAEIVVDQTAAAADPQARVIVTQGYQSDRKTSEWIDQIIQEHEGFTSIWGDVDSKPGAVSAYYDEFFDAEKFAAFKLHYDTYGAPPYAVQFKTTVEEIVIDEEFGARVEQNEIVNEKIGEGDPVIFFTARKRPDKTVELVVSIHDDSFKANDLELEAVGWKNSDKQWINPGDEQIYNTQLAEMKKYRQLMIGLIAYDYDNVVQDMPDSPEVGELEKEPYPEYEFGQWGVLTKMMEFLELGYHVGHKFEMPRGTWDPEFKIGDEEFVLENDDHKRASAERWRTKSPASVGGVVDGSLLEVKDMAEMIKLAQSLCYKSTWVQILEAAKNFNAGDQIKSMISSFEDEIGELKGDDGVYEQYHAIGEVTVRTLATIYAGWKLVKKFGPNLASNNPTKALEKRHLDIDANFKGINKTPEFDNLPKDLQEKLIKDIAETGDDQVNELLDAISGNSKFIDSWKKLDEAGVDVAIRRNPDWLKRTSDWTDKGLEIASEGKILNNGSEVGRILGDRLLLNYSGYGRDIVCDVNKTTTGIGKYDPPGGVGTKHIIDSKLSKSGENPGGINILNDTRNTQGWNNQKIWDEINQPWLDDAIARGDNIRAVSDPLKIENVFSDIKDIPASVFSSPESLSTYLKSLNDADVINQLSFYGREIRHLSQTNYLFDTTTKAFVK